MDVREERTKDMPFKLDAAGNIAISELNGKKLPVFVYADGRESPFDADETVTTIGRLNGEAKTHREAKELAEGTLVAYAKIADPAKAVAALELVANIDAKKLVDAGEIQKVRDEIGKSYKEQIDDLTGQLKTSNEAMTDMHIGGAFNTSAFIKEKCAIPADFVRARFGSNFKVEAGKVVAVDSSGNKLYSRANPGELAGFDEAAAMLIEAHPQRDSILKGTGANGGGGGGGKPNGQGGGKQYTRSQFETLDVAARGKVMAEGAKIVEG